MDDDLAFFAHADALCAHAGDLFHGEVHDAALAGRHGIQAKGLLGLLHAFRSHARGHF